MTEKENRKPLTNEQLEQVTGGKTWHWRCNQCNGSDIEMINASSPLNLRCKSCGNTGYLSYPPAASDAFYLKLE